VEDGATQPTGLRLAYNHFREPVMSMSSVVRNASLAFVCLTALAAVNPASAQGRFHFHAASGPRGTAVGGGYTRWGNGSVTHQGAHYFQGSNGASYAGHNSFTANANGSASSSHHFSGTTAAGGSYSSSGAYSRSTSGAVTGSSQTNASGPRGAYDASTSTANGTTTHDTTATNAATGVTYDGQTTYTKGQGFTHSGSCTNASGATVSCGQ
jgi:hypothetical protein